MRRERAKAAREAWQSLLCERKKIGCGELGGATAPNREERMTETFAAAVNRRDCEYDRIPTRLSNAIRGLN
jgi:hypothetical protein